MRHAAFIFGLAAVPAFSPPAPAAQARQSASAQEDEAEERKIVGGGKLAPGWMTKVDRNGPVTKIKLESAANGIHIETAASAVFFRPGERLSRNYHLAGTFTQNEFSPGHAEPYGLIFGGELRGDTLDYTYFMVQSDGKFSIRRRSGARSQDLASGWMEHAAIQKANDKGTCTNRLMVERTPAAVRFLINGTEVFKTTPDAAKPDGITGLRVSHNLSVDVASPMRMQM